jgi:hypothetical protein
MNDTERWSSRRLRGISDKCTTGITRGGWHDGARRNGLEVHKYLAKRAAGQKRCRRCRLWLATTRFSSDRSRSDGLKTICRKCSTAVRKKTGAPRGRGPQASPERDGDAKQARRRVNVLINTGRLPRPNDCACHDCGHIHAAGERRHEYDHYLGYGTGNHLKVQAACSRCHHTRETNRRHNHE